jgi:hypothetical protein
MVCYLFGLFNTYLSLGQIMRCANLEARRLYLGISLFQHSCAFIIYLLQHFLIIIWYLKLFPNVTLCMSTSKNRASKCSQPDMQINFDAFSLSLCHYFFFSHYDFLCLKFIVTHTYMNLFVVMKNFRNNLTTP